MHLMYTLDDAGKRIYTLKKVVGAEVTKSAHPARFSPDDKYSRCVVEVLSSEHCCAVADSSVQTTSHAQEALRPSSDTARLVGLY